MIKKEDEISVDVIDLTSEGKGISKLEDGFVIFSEKTLPGDKALIKILRKKSSYAEAKLIKIERPSEYRIDAECSHFGICGGCKIQNYDYIKQVEFKTNVVKNAFERIGGFSNLEIPVALQSNNIFHYRNKMEFSFTDDEWLDEKDMDKVKGKYVLGLHVPKFHSKIVEINKCYLQSDLANGVLNLTNQFFKSRNIPVYSTKNQTGILRFLIIRECKNTNDLMVNLITFDYDEKLMKEYSEELINKFPEITTIINSTSQKKAQVAYGENENILYGNGFITEKLKRKSNQGANKEFDFKISPQSFFQTNTLQAEKLFGVLVDFAEFSKGDNVLDLYCGTGSISIFISDLVNKVTGVELIPNSINDAGTNSKLNDTDNCEFICSDIKDFLEKTVVSGNFNKLILDPPRAGLHPKICEILSDTQFEKIIYVSCNPQTQARDIQIICSKENYVIDKIQPVDMFPHTYHIENIVSLIRK